MGAQFEVEGFIREGGIYLEGRTNREGMLIGKEGKVLDSLQFLINRMVKKRLGESIKIYLDINQYKAKKVERLSKMALRLGKKVKKSGKSILIGPYNPHDRRVIHLALKNDPSIKTESLGEGEMKKIRIFPVGHTT